MYWGIKVSQSETMKALGYSGQLIGFTLLVTIILIGFSAYTLAMFKMTQKRSVNIIYTVMLLVSLMFFGWVAF